MMPITFPLSVSSRGTSGRSLGLIVTLGSRNLIVAMNLILLRSAKLGCFYIGKVTLCLQTDRLGYFSLTGLGNCSSSSVVTAARISFTMKRISRSTRYAWAFVAAVLLLIDPSISTAQLTTLRVGTNSPASTEAVLFSIAKDAGILKHHQLDAEVIYIAGGTLSVQALVGRSLDFMCTGGTPFIYAYLEGVQGKIIGGVNNRLPYGFVSL